MSPFGRRRRAARESEEEPVATGASTAPGTDAAEQSGSGDRAAADVPTRGPWDVSQVSELGPRMDLGALRIPALPGMQVRIEMDKSNTRVVAVNLALGGSALQLQAFAAPRTEGIWEELRPEIAASVTSRGGTADDVVGPFGAEILARLPVENPDGGTGHRPARFIGIDGPRWFVRGVLTGRAAVDPEAAKVLEAVLANVVVVRDAEARAPRDLLPLHLPGRPPGTVQARPADPPPPESRGPEITETR